MCSFIGAFNGFIYLFIYLLFYLIRYLQSIKRIVSKGPSLVQLKKQVG